MEKSRPMDIDYLEGVSTADYMKNIIPKTKTDGSNKTSKTNNTSTMELKYVKLNIDNSYISLIPKFSYLEMENALMIQVYGNDIYHYQRKLEKQQVSKYFLKKHDIFDNIRLI